MGQNEDFSDLQREWREIVLNKLDHLELGQRDIQKDMTEVKLNFVKAAEFDETVRLLKKRLYELEQLKAKSMGVFFTLQVIFGIIIFVITKFG